VGPSLPILRRDAGPDDVTEGELRSVPLEAGHVALVSRVAGVVVAIDDRCNHAGCLLSKGWVEERAVVCPCHEYAFDLVTGANTSAWKLCGDQDRFEVELVEGRMLLSGPVTPGR
jgi:3-phenylpropionate/trans-cinnamate dioxygenase ferredoxin subunit